MPVSAVTPVTAVMPVTAVKPGTTVTLVTAVVPVTGTTATGYYHEQGCQRKKGLTCKIICF